MAAGSSSGSKASVGALEAALDRKLQSVTNTMESIQSLSGWCLDNRKQHAAIVHYWMKWFRRSGFAHRLNLFYLANDIIQNCKRKNALIFRDSFADVLPEAASLVRDPSVMKSVERVFKIWEERNVYSEEVIASFRSALSGGWNKRERSERSKSSRPKQEKPPEVPQVNPKAALKSKIVAEFRPQMLIEDLLSYKRSIDHVELKEKQLSNMRVDVCSSETLKRLKDKAGGKKFSKDFEEASSKLEEFVSLLDKQVKNGPSVAEALENAGIFYEAQYREVKVVVNAYKTFANRVNNLKKKLDQLKSTLPDPEESPLPSPAADAPSPTGSESPFEGMGDISPLSPEVEPLLSPPEPPKDNRVVEDMEMSEDEETHPIIVEEAKDHLELSTSLQDMESIASAATLISEDSTSASVPAMESPPPPPPPPVTVSVATLSASRSPATTAPVATTPAKTVTTPTISPAVPLALPNLANVDLGKISSILSSLTSAMKTSGVSPASKPSPGTPTTPTSNMTGTAKTPVQSTPNPLANILSKVDFTPESILSALSKTQASTTQNLQGLSSLIQGVTASASLSSGSNTLTTSTAPVNPVKDKVSPSAAPPFMSKNYGYSGDLNPDVPLTPACKTSTPLSSSISQPVDSFGFPTHAPLADEKTINQTSNAPKQSEENEPSSLELKIHNFLKGNPGFSGLDLNIPILSGLGPTSVPEPSSEFHSGSANNSLDNIDGTPVRDERSGTPTQDEIMDKPSTSNVDSLLSKIISPGSSTPSSSRSPLLNKDTEYQKLQTLPPYRSLGLPSDSPNAYRQPSDMMDKPSIVDSPLDKFFSGPDFHEDEDYRNFDFSGPSAMSNLDAMPGQPVMKQNLHVDSMEYPPITQSYNQASDYGRQPFPPSMQPPFISGDNSNRLSPPPDRYGGYSLRGNNLEASRSPSPLKDDPFYLSDPSHNMSLLHPSLQQTQFPDPSHVQNRHLNFLPTNNLPSTRPPILSAEQSGQTNSTIEFKNLLKNASRRPTEDPPFGKPSLDEDSRNSGLGPAGMSSEDQSDEMYRIETRVSSSSPDTKEEKGAPIETLGYHNVGSMRMSGEPIKTVESMRVGMKGGRGHGLDASTADWFEMGSTEGSFDEPNTDDPPSVSGSSGVSFKPQYDEHITRFQDPVSDFRPANMPSFDRLLPPPPMPPMLDRGGPFQMDQSGPPPVPPPVLPPDPGSLFGREIPVGPRMPSMEPSTPLPPIGHLPPADILGNPFPVHHTPEHGGIPFSPPPTLEMRNPYSKDHGSIHQGMINEPYTLLSSSTMDRRSHDYNNQNDQTHGRVNDHMASLSRDHFGGFGGSQQQTGQHHRDHMHAGGPRNQRPQFRPREQYQNLKRPRPPYGRGQQFYSPKRPFYPPRY